MYLVRNILFLCCLSILASCGFKPLYGTNKHNGQLSAFNTIYIENIPDSTGVYLKNKLIDSFYSHGRPLNPQYTLSVNNLRESRRGLDVTKSADATRAQLRYNAEVILRDNKSGQILLDRKFISITSYNILQSQFTTHVSEENARKNALTDIAKQIENALALYFSRN